MVQVKVGSSLEHMDLLMCLNHRINVTRTSPSFLRLAVMPLDLGVMLCL
jgi:hypothetical protein